jgi:hypothetical protein
MNFIWCVFLVAPTVRAPSQLLGAPLGSDVQLECHVEASPSPVSYWLKGGKGSPNGYIGGIGAVDTGQQRSEMLLDGSVIYHPVL